MLTPRRWAVILAVLGVALYSIVGLWFNARSQEQALNDSRSANMQWVTGQVLVEYQDMMFALHAAEEYPNDAIYLGEFRNRFDILYSRMDSLGASPRYAHLFESESFARSFTRIQGALIAAVPQIDGPDEDLWAALPTLHSQFRGFERDIRRFGLEASIAFTSRSDTLRKALAATMNKLAGATILMVALLAVLTAIVFRDGRVSERQFIEQRRTSARLDTIVNTSLDAIVVSDLSGNIMEFNGAAERIFGHSPDTAAGMTLCNLIDTDGTKVHDIARTSDLIGRGVVEVAGRHASGKVFPLEINVESVDTDEGPLLVSFLSDISLRKAAENELITARDKALAGQKAKDGFVAMISHELRTPLNGILGILALLRGTRLTEAQRDYADKIESSGQILLSYVSDVLDISRADAGKLDLEPTSTELAPYLQSVIDGLSGAAAAQGNELGFDPVGDLPDYLMIDKVRLRQVLVNLLGNAIKFTTDGQIMLEAELLKGSDGREILELRVADTGIGMAEDELPRIFEDFEMLDSSFARRQTGAGLGLSIVKRIVDAMEGEVFVESEPGEGSLFTVVIPATRCGPAKAVTARKQGTGTSRSARYRNVLVVDDNDINRAVIGGLLTQRGCTVVEADGGEASIAKASRTAFDLILMDLSMPRVDGIQAAERIRNGGGPSAATPIIAVTAHAALADPEAMQAAGLSGILTKPLDVDRIDALLDDRAPPAHAAPAPRADTPEVLDTGHLVQLDRDLGGEMLDRLLTRFQAEARAEADNLSQTDLDAPLPDDLQSRVHQLAGAAASFGAQQLAQRLRRIESGLTAGNRDAVRANLPQLASDWSAVEAGLDRWRRNARAA